MREKYRGRNRFTESIFRMGEKYFVLYYIKGARRSFSHIYASNFWKSRESRSGPGSSLESTAVIRKALPKIIGEYSIESMLDAPCGDYNWMKTIDKKCDYIGGDIAPDMVAVNNEKYSSEKVRFMHIDIITSELLEVDLIFCRDCLQHLSYENISKALDILNGTERNI